MRGWRKGRDVEKTTVRGYGQRHQLERKRLAPIVARGEAVCCECGRRISPDAEWHLAHDHRNGGWAGPAHARCNLAERNRRHARVRPARRHSRVW